MTPQEKEIWNLVAEKFVGEYGDLADDDEELVCIFEQLLGEQIER